MPSAEEIAERVRQADLQRIERRAERASAVADQAVALDEARARVQQLSKELGSAVVSAAEVMELDELRDFTDRTASEINEWASTGGVPQQRHIKGGRRRSSGGSRARSRSARNKTAATTQTDSAGSGVERDDGAAADGGGPEAGSDTAAGVGG